MSELDEHYKRLENVAKDCGLSPEQLQKLIRLVLNLTNARIRTAKMQKSKEPLMSGTGL